MDLTNGAACRNIDGRVVEGMDSHACKFNMQEAIKTEVEKIRRKYLDSAEEIVSGYNRELELSKDYEGRQIFELLQNADDEAEGSSGNVRIAFDGKTLSVSNTGEPFSFRGVKSLLYPYASPKKIHADKIGCKGLGFRSVLTWANSVTVASKDFTIRFSQKHAKTFLQSVLEENPKLQEGILALSKEPWPVATLTCPEIMEESALEDGYSTSIVIECRENLSDVIREQIVSLQFEELVFLPNLKEIEIVCNDYRRNFYKIAEGNEVIIEAVDLVNKTTECACWSLYKKTGIIKDEDANEKKYEFIIAYDPTEERTGEVLYSYFKTDVKMGFPALIHGTFELTSDRNSLQKQSQVNKQLVPLLAEFMVQTAVTISKEQGDCSYKPLRLAIASEIDIVLKNSYGFDRILREKVRNESILPTIGNKYISVNDEPKYSNNLFASSLAPEQFPELLKPADSFIEKYLKSDLGISFYDYHDFCKRLNEGIDAYSLEEKAKIISLVEKVYPYISSPGCFPHLLVDSNGQNICDPVKVYPLPKEEQVISLPVWVDTKFLSSDLEKLLVTEYGFDNTRRQFVWNLSRYNMEEYSFEKLLRSIVNQFDKSPESSDRCADVLSWLWNYYNREDCQAIPDVRVKLICRDGSIRYAKECYIGTEYGNSLGERLVSIYSQNFVALKELKIDCEDVKEISAFLEWLGVAKYPRIIRKSLTGEERRTFLKTCYPLYVREDNYYYGEYEFNNIQEVSVGSIEHLEQLIMEANFNDLLSWLVLDIEVNQRICSYTEEQNSFARITGYPGYKKNLRTVKPNNIKSYLRYYLSSEKWIPDENGNKEKPAYCCFEDNSLAPFIIVPKIDYGFIKNVVGRNCQKEVEAILSRLGVADVFQEMKKTVVYQALLKLPELDYEHKLAKTLYRKIVKNGLTPDEYMTDNPDYVHFIKNGSVLAKRNGKKLFVPVSQARYADKKVFSEDILNSFNMLDVDARSGEDKIEKLFGVQLLKYTNVEMVGAPVIHPLDEDFKREYQRFIPFVYACRIGLKNANTDFRNLKSSKIILCSSITFRYSFGSENRISTLKAYEPVYLRKGNTAYICVPEKCSDFTELKKNYDFADAVAEMISAILNVNEGKDFYRDLFRENDYIREKKMRNDKGDENLQILAEARRKFKSDVNLRDEFWMTLADIVHVTNEEMNSPTADELIAAMHIPADIDYGLKFDNLSSFENIPILLRVFSKIGIDAAQFNAVASQYIDVSTYWASKLKAKMQLYRSRYQAYLIDELATDENAIIQYDQYMEDYDYLEPDIENSFFVDVDSVFTRECGVSFDVLDAYSAEKTSEIMTLERSKVSDQEWESLNKFYSPTTIDTYLILGRIHDLQKLSDETAPTKPNLNQREEQNFMSLAREVFASPAQGFSYVELHATDKTAEKYSDNGNGAKSQKHQKLVHSELSDQRKQEIGIVGELFVFKELLALNPDARWVSGNAEKAGHTIKGDDTCGYDIKYTDEKGMIQYVEVKASRSEDISFLISDRELKFGCKNAENYEIIYVVIGDDGKTVHQLYRLGHIFAFLEGEDIFHNHRFSIESDSYRIHAEPIMG